MIAGCDHNRVDVWVFDELSQIGCGLCVGKPSLGLGHTGGIWIAQSNDFDSWDFGETSHEFIRTTATTEKSNSDFIVGRCISGELGGNRKTSSEHRGMGEKPAAMFAGCISVFHREDCSLKQRA